MNPEIYIFVKICLCMSEKLSLYLNKNINIGTYIFYVESATIEMCPVKKVRELLKYAFPQACLTWEERFKLQIFFCRRLDIFFLLCGSFTVTGICGDLNLLVCFIMSSIDAKP